MKKCMACGKETEKLVCRECIIKCYEPNQPQECEHQWTTEGEGWSTYCIKCGYIKPQPQVPEILRMKNFSLDNWQVIINDIIYKLNELILYLNQTGGKG